jgi:hypothetical protein
VHIPYCKCGNIDWGGVNEVKIPPGQIFLPIKKHKYW